MDFNSSFHGNHDTLIRELESNVRVLVVLIIVCGIMKSAFNYMVFNPSIDPPRHAALLGGGRRGPREASGVSGRPRGVAGDNKDELGASHPVRVRNSAMPTRRYAREQWHRTEHKALDLSGGGFTVIFHTTVGLAEQGQMNNSVGR